MKATYKLADPDSAEATLTITMTLGAWKKLREGLAGIPNPMSYPNFKIRDLLDELIKNAQKEFQAEGAID